MLDFLIFEVMRLDLPRGAEREGAWEPWIDVESIMVSETSQREGDRHKLILLIYGIQQETIQ